MRAGNAAPLSHPGDIGNQSSGLQLPYCFFVLALLRVALRAFQSGNTEASHIRRAWFGQALDSYTIGKAHSSCLMTTPLPIVGNHKWADK